MSYIIKIENETDIYQYNTYHHSPDDLPYFYEFVIEIIELINQDARFLYADYDNDDECCCKYNDIDLINNMKYKYIDDALSKLSYSDCDKFICEIGLNNAFNLYDNSGYDDVSMRELRNIKGIRKLLFGIINVCIETRENVEELNE
jgi:hypothetical protein